MEPITIPHARDATQQFPPAKGRRLDVRGPWNPAQEAPVKGHEAQDAECREGGGEDELARVAGGEVGGPGRGVLWPFFPGGRGGAEGPRGHYEGGEGLLDRGVWSIGVARRRLGFRGRGVGKGSRVNTGGGTWLRGRNIAGTEGIVVLAC